MAGEYPSSEITPEETEQQNLLAATRLLRDRVYDLILSQGDNLEDNDAYLFLQSKDRKTLFSLHANCLVSDVGFSEREFRTGKGITLTKDDNIRFDIQKFDLRKGPKPSRRYSPITLPADRYIAILGSSTGAYLSPYESPINSTELMEIYNEIGTANKINQNHFFNLATRSSR